MSKITFYELQLEIEKFIESKGFGIKSANYTAAKTYPDYRIEFVVSPKRREK